MARSKAVWSRGEEGGAPGALTAAGKRPAWPGEGTAGPLAHLSAGHGVVPGAVAGTGARISPRSGRSAS